MRIALLFRSYGPYHLARLNALRQRHSVIALEYADADADYDWQEAERKREAGVITLRDTNSSASRTAPFATRLTAELRRFAPDAMAIPGYAEPFALSALRTCKTLGIPAVLMSDTHAGSVSRHAARETLKRQLMPLYRSALVAGAPHVEYLVSLGFPAQSIATGFDVVDNRHFAHDVRGDLRKVTGLPQSFFLCCARFIAKKNLPFLIEAFARYRGEHTQQTWDLVIAGDGPLRETLARRATELSIASSVHLLGHKSYSDLPEIYASASAFVLPSSTDEWGLVVNEAMAAGLPVLVSKGAGCHCDLVAAGVNGFIFDPGNAGELANLMGALATSDKRSEMGAASRRIIADWDLDRFVQGMTRAIEIAKHPRSEKRFHVGTAVAAALSLRI